MLAYTAGPHGEALGQPETGPRQAVDMGIRSRRRLPETVGSSLAPPPVTLRLGYYSDRNANWKK